MRFAAIADIHGNALALEAVLADIARQGITDIVNLGDVFSGPLEAGRTAEILLPLNLPTICGNHDRYLIKQQPAEMGPSDAQALAQLDAAALNWLRALPETLAWREDILLCHGTPQSDEAYWLERATAHKTMAPNHRTEIESIAEGHDYQLMLCAHTHTQRIVALADGRMIVNPGSVGCPGYTDDTPPAHIMQSGSPHARYAVLEKSVSGWQATFHAVAYDWHAMSALAAQNNRNEWASALATGWIEG